MKAWCDRQERHHREVIEKLRSWGYHGDQAQGMLAELISLNYVSEERFARAYCSGKFRIKGWGRIKIRQNLKAIGVSDYCIRKGMEEIDEEEYLTKLNEWIERKSKDYRGGTVFHRNGKIADFIQRKGYEADLLWSLLREREQ